MIVVVWVGAGVSKLGVHFSEAVASVVSNTPWMLRCIEKAHDNDRPDDLQPSPIATSMLLQLIAPGPFVFPVLGNVRPDLVSFLPPTCKYAGNRASAQWAFAPLATGQLPAHAPIWVAS